jgi:Putative zinc-finger
MNGAGECAQIRIELGVYLLGAIEPAERALVDEHLVSCARCRQELAGLAGLPGLLRKVTAEGAQSARTEEAGDPLAGVPLDALIGRVTAILRRRRRLTVVAAGALLAAVAGVAGVHVLGAHPVGPPDADEPRWTASAAADNRETGAWAAVRYAAQPWGTELEVQVTGIGAGTRCQLVVTGARGQDVDAGGWTITAGSPQAWYPASVPFRPGTLRGFAVTADGKTLVSVPAR